MKKKNIQRGMLFRDPLGLWVGLGTDDVRVNREQEIDILKIMRDFPHGMIGMVDVILTNSNEIPRATILIPLVEFESIKSIYVPTR